MKRLIVVSIACGLLFGCKEMSDYAKKGKTGEQTENLDKLFAGARAYYSDEHGAAGSMTPVAHAFPSPGVGPTPPIGTCCSNGGKCAPDQAQWGSDPVWNALKFSVDRSHYFSYEYRTDGSNSFTVLAYADLDCDGTSSTYSLTGTVKDGEVTKGTIEARHPNE